MFGAGSVLGGLRMVLGTGCPMELQNGWGAVVAAGCGEGLVVRGDLLSREFLEEMLGFPGEQELTALLLPLSQSKYTRRFGAKAHQIIKE